MASAERWVTASGGAGRVRAVESTLMPSPVSFQLDPEKSRRRRMRRVALLGLAVLAALIGVGWWVAAGSRLAAVDLIAAPGGVTCERGNVVLPELETFSSLVSETELLTVVQSEPDMQCSVALFARNNGDSEVRLGRLVIPIMGPRAGAAVQVVGVSPVGDVDGDVGGYDSGDVDAVVNVDAVLVPGAMEPLVLKLAFREDGCHGPGTVVTPGGPFLRIHALGRAALREPALPPFAIEGSTETVCSP